MEFVVVQGDIADEAADALVSPDDTGLSMSGGASAALAEAAGDNLHTAAQSHAQLALGEVAVTLGFNLFASYVGVHADSETLGKWHPPPSNNWRYGRSLGHTPACIAR